MNIVLTSVFVEDQQKALEFYTAILGFRVKNDIDMGGPRWLTLVSPDHPEGPELLLEPSDHPAVRPFKNALMEDGIPFASFGVADVEAEYNRLSALGIKFVQPPTDLGSVVTAVLDDTCGNLIQIAEAR
jgi:catechol 2,3-dioxygenase-like lactoylglutathione lyase family enzyme